MPVWHAGAVSVMADEKPYETEKGMTNPPVIVEGTEIDLDGDYYAHGYAMLGLKGDTATVDYCQLINGKPETHHRETIG